MNKDEKWMKMAIDEAIKAEKEGEIPIGAILIKNDNIIAKGHNQPISTHDASAHAEINAIRLAGNVLKNYRLNGSSLYVTLEPCAMCLGAIIHARIEKLVFGAYDVKTGVCGSCDDLTNANFFNHKLKIIGGTLETECSHLLSEFFKSKRLGNIT
jgi:tRNA(adenine34) deaminase